MFTPQRRGWPGWALPPSSERRDKGKVLSPEIRTAAGNDTSPMKSLIEAPPITSLEDNGGLPNRSGTEIWRRFRDAGALDEDSLEKKDRAALLAHIATLDGELYDYQYNMGLLLMERKEWDLKIEKLKATAVEAEENLKRERGAHLIAISEAEKREEGLKKALAVEKQCVSDLEKALKEMRAEAAEVKVSAENKLSQARDMVAGTEERALLAESKLHAAEALQAEASRKHTDAERKLQEVEAREDSLRRERHTFKSDATKIVSQAASVDDKERGISDQVKEQKASEVFQEVSSPELPNAGDKEIQTELFSLEAAVDTNGELNMHNGLQGEERRELVDVQVSVHLNEVNDGLVNAEEELGETEQVRLNNEDVEVQEAEDGAGEEDEGEEAEDADGEEEEEEEGEQLGQVVDEDGRGEAQVDEGEEDDEQQKPTLKEKLWDFFTT